MKKKNAKKKKTTNENQFIQVGLNLRIFYGMVVVIDHEPPSPHITASKRADSP